MIFIRPSGGKFCIRSMPMKDNAEHYSRRPVVQRGYSHTSGLSDKGMANGGRCELNPGQIGALGGTDRGASPNNPRPNKASYDIAKPSYKNAKKAVI